MVITQLVSAFLFVIVEPSITFYDALYHCIISATTVGYGDVHLSQQLARLWATAHILFSTSWLAALISHVNELLEERRAQLRRADLLQKQLDPGLVCSLDMDGRGVDQVEFVVGMLIALGVEVCGW